MEGLAAKDSYIQKLASKVCAQQNQEQRKKTFVPFRSGGDTGPPKKNKRKLKKSTGNGLSQKKPTPKAPQKPAALKGHSTAEQNALKAKITSGATVAKTQSSKGGKAETNFSAVDVLRKRLHEKIEESRGQGAQKNPFSEEVQAKRAKRKLERERKKRKRKEFRMKKLAEKASEEQPQEIKQEEEPAPVPTAGKRDETAIIFNKVEMVEEGYVNKIQKKMEKKKNVKGKLTPLTGKNYKQLLTRVEARNAKLEKLRETDMDKAREMEEKMKWTNVLYKAEGLKIKDDEDMLRASLKRKEKMRSQRKKRWDERCHNVVEKMQHRQEKRRRNIQKRKKGKIEKKKDRARKKGRVLPEDLKKAAV